MGFIQVYMGIEGGGSGSGPTPGAAGPDIVYAENHPHVFGSAQYPGVFRLMVRRALCWIG